MVRMTRRAFLAQSAAAMAGLSIAPSMLRAAPAQSQPREKYITNFYQFENKHIEILAAPSALPNGAEYLHIFAQSSPGMKPHPERVKAVHAGGKNFKFAAALDVHKYKEWGKADDKQLKGWGKQFRRQ